MIADYYAINPNLIPYWTVYLLIALAIWIGVQPYRLRDFFNWLFLRPGRTRGVGGALLAYGLLLAAVAFTY